VKSRKEARGLYLIAAFKMFKGLALLAVGVGALRLLHRDSAKVVQYWVDLLRVDPENHYIHKLIGRILQLDARKLKELSAGTFFYSGLLITEGIGLALRKRWAEYFTVIATGLFIPLEIYELTRKPDWARVLVLLINTAVVVYLILVLRRGRK
jgi:uncharacterized membrane protein (DUF2068 family)